MKKILIMMSLLTISALAAEPKQCIENKLTNLVSILSCTHGEYKVTYKFSGSTTNGIPQRDEKAEPKIELLSKPCK